MTGKNVEIKINNAILCFEKAAIAATTTTIIII